MNALEQAIFLHGKLIRTEHFSGDGWGDILCFSTYVFPLYKGGKFINDMHLWHIYRSHLILSALNEQGVPDAKEEIINLHLYSLANLLYSKFPSFAITFLNRFKKQYTSSLNIHSLSKLQNKDVNRLHRMFAAGKIFVRAHEEAHESVKTGSQLLYDFIKSTNQRIDELLLRYEASSVVRHSSFFHCLAEFSILTNERKTGSSDIIESIYNEIFADYMGMESVFAYLEEEFNNIEIDTKMMICIDFCQSILSFIYCLSDFRDKWIKYISIADNDPKNTGIFSPSDDGLVHGRRLGGSFCLSGNSSLSTAQIGFFERLRTSLRSQLSMYLFLLNHEISNPAYFLAQIPLDKSIPELYYYLRDNDFINEIILESHENKKYLKQKYDDEWLGYIENVFSSSLNAQNGWQLIPVSEIDLPSSYEYKKQRHFVTADESDFITCIEICKGYAEQLITYDEFKKRLHDVGNRINNKKKLFALANKLDNYCTSYGVRCPLGCIERGFDGIDGFMA